MLRKLVPLFGQSQPCLLIIVANRRRREVTALIGFALESLGIDLRHGVSFPFQPRRLGGVPWSGSYWTTVVASQRFCRRFTAGERLARVLRMTMENRKSVYEPLRLRLLRESNQSLRLTFAEIEAILGRKLPRSAHTFSAWWSNESSMKVGHTQAKAWMEAGFRAHASIKNRMVEFRRA